MENPYQVIVEEHRGRLAQRLKIEREVLRGILSKFPEDLPFWEQARLFRTVDGFLLTSLELAQQLTLNCVHAVVNKSIADAVEGLSRKTIPLELQNSIKGEIIQATINNRYRSKTFPQRIQRIKMHHTVLIRHDIRQTLSTTSKTSHLYAVLSNHFDYLNYASFSTQVDRLLVGESYRAHHVAITHLAKTLEVLVEWITVDTCDLCTSAQGIHSPFKISEYPHPFCRCWLRVTEST